MNKTAPVLAGFFLFAALSSLALPGLVSFVGEFLVLLGTFERYMWVGALATLGIVITAAYVLRLYQRTMTGPAEAGAGRHAPTSKGREITALVPIAGPDDRARPLPGAAPERHQPRGRPRHDQHRRDRPAPRPSALGSAPWKGLSK